jgi:starch synthase
MDKKNKNLKILLVASECAPLVKVGGLGDVVGSLPEPLRKIGADARVCLPKYGFIDPEKLGLKKISEKEVMGEKIVIWHKEGIYFLENEKYFGTNDVYFSKTAFADSIGEIQRFSFFSKAVFEIFNASASRRKEVWDPNIIHCNDWHSAAIPALLKLKKSPIKSILTIHNLANKGGNILQQGIFNADLITTVSKKYSKEILTKEFGCGLEKHLLKRKKDIVGILNAIDVDFFNPETDKNIKNNYSSQSLDKKIVNKTYLQEKLGLKKDIQAVLFGIVSRLTSQKGIDLIIGAIPKLINLNCQFVILGVGEDECEKRLISLAEKYPLNVSANIKFDAVLAQQIYAGSDVFLMPSRFEPCGLGQMIAQRYGTLPLVRETGGLADTVKDNKTGFVFKKYSELAFLNKTLQAIKAFKNNKKWHNMQKSAMSKDFSWDKSAKEYLAAYKKVLR